MKLDADWMRHAGTESVMAALHAAGFQAYFVGGCVRNGLIGAPVEDIDIATDATPDQVIAVAEAAKLRAVPTGVEHGTVTVVADHKPHEITTFRKDVETFGRHATVAFSTDLADDAARRDFTMNALYAGADGRVIDPTEAGIVDLKARRLRFIGAPEDRIREDFLRILRFFRFHAWYADQDGGLDAEGLAACATLSSGLDTLSKERIGAEIKKLLAAPDPSRAVAAMAQTGVLARVLPGASAKTLMIVITLEAAEGIAPDPIRRLVALGGPAPVVALRLSRAEAKRWSTLTEAIGAASGPGELGYRHGAEIARDILLLRAATFEQPLQSDALARVADGARAVFPISASDLMPALSGPALGDRLAALEARWIASEFRLDKSDLLS